MKKKTWLKKKKSHLLKVLQEDYFNVYIRLRDTDEYGYANCISCGKQVQYGTIDCQAGHYIPVSMSSYWRFDEDNVNVQCSRCNNWAKEEAKLNYRKGMEDKYGVDHEKKMWEDRHNQKDWTKEELIDMIFEYKELIEEQKSYKMS